MIYQKCPVCGMPAQVHSTDVRGDNADIDCVRCGRFHTSEDMEYWLRETKWEPRQVAAISYYIRRNEGLTIARMDLEKLRTLKIPSVPTKLGRLLTFMSRRFPMPGENIEVPAWAYQHIEGIVQLARERTDYSDHSFSEDGIPEAAYGGEVGLINSAELHWLIYSGLILQGYLAKGDTSGSVKITPLGWQEIARMETVNASSKIGFVAMSFQPEFVRLYDEGLAPGIAAAGYEPMRLDRTEHNNRIDDEIIAQIKQSRFLVGDFSRNRGGIYFEAGLAMGLGLPVIWTLREDEHDELHFDTRQFNHIPWTLGNLPTFARALQVRIERTIGKGPISGVS